MEITKAAPLSAGFMLTSIIGFMLSILIIYPRWPTWGFTFTLIFTLMFISSVISMTYSEAESHLAIHKRKK